MNVKSIAIIALLATTSTAALAADTASTPATSPQKADIQQKMTTNLQQSGFTDVAVMPDSFLVQAKDRSGNPVTMFITPSSMTEFVGNTTGTAAMDTSAGSNNGMFRNIPAKSELTSKVVGLDVYNNDNKSIGQIKDMALNGNGRIEGYIVSVGGFLGIGDHYVAVRPSAVELTWDSSAKKWHAKMNATADQLKAAPEYKYAS